MVEQVKDLREYILPVKYKNINPTADYDTTIYDQEYYISDYISLKSKEDVPYAYISNANKGATDYAAVCGAKLSPYKYIANFGGYYSAYYLRSTSNRNLIDSVNEYTENVMTSAFSLHNGFVPVMELKIPQDISQIGTLNVETVTLGKEVKQRPILKMGQTVRNFVPEELNDVLERLYNKGQLNEQLQPTGLWYTSNCYSSSQSEFALKHNPEFVYKNKKYVRYTQIINNMFKVYWLSVEPASFLITNWDNLPQHINPNGTGTDTSIMVESVNVLGAGIPFSANKTAQVALWQDSLLRHYLNSAKVGELDYNHNYKNKVIQHLNTPYLYDFTNCGFMYETFNMARQPVTEYTIPEWQTKIGDNAFNGCVTLQRLNIPAHVTELDARWAEGISKNTRIHIQLTNEKPKYNLYAFGFDANNYKYIYVSPNGIDLVNDICPELEGKSIRVGFNSQSLNNLINPNYRINLINLATWKQQGKIKFIPPAFVPEIFPSSQMQNFYINNNHLRWGKLVKALQLDTLDADTKQNCIPDLLKIYYALGGFSTNQAESIDAYDYILNNVATNKVKSSNNKITPQDIAENLHKRFSRIVLDGPHNPMFAKFFMKYYADNPDFMVFKRENRYRIQETQDYICMAHNGFNDLVKTYPSRVVTGNEERSLFTPQFVAEHVAKIEYTNVPEWAKKLASMAGKYGYSQWQFTQMAEILKKAQTIENPTITAVPDVSNNPITYKILRKTDEQGFFIGDDTNCCQHIGGAGASCVIDGYTNKDAGFLVFKQPILDDYGKVVDERLLAQSYVWYDPKTKTVCLDNIEVATKVLEELRSGTKHKKPISTIGLLQAVDNAAKAIMRSMNKNGVEVNYVTVGTGFNDINKELLKAYGTPQKKNLAKHRSYNGYSDAKTAQYKILESANAKQPKGFWPFKRHTQAEKE